MRDQLMDQIDPNPFSESSDVNADSSSMLSPQNGEPLSPIDPSRYYYCSFPVPVSKWIAVDDDALPSCGTPCTAANLVYHRTCILNSVQ